MFQTFRNAWKIPELKNRLLFTLAILVVYRLGCAIPVPFVSGSALTQICLLYTSDAADEL